MMDLIRCVLFVVLMGILVCLLIPILGLELLIVWLMSLLEHD